MKSMHLIVATATFTIATAAMPVAAQTRAGDAKGAPLQRQAASAPGAVQPALTAPSLHNPLPAPVPLGQKLSATPAAAPASATFAPKGNTGTLAAPAVPAPLAASCGPGFSVSGLKLQKHEGKAWYEYQCVAEQQINRTCNADTTITAVKDEFVSLPSDEQSHNSRLQMSYKCWHYVPVK